MNSSADRSDDLDATEGPSREGAGRRRRPVASIRAAMGLIAAIGFMLIGWRAYLDWQLRRTVVTTFYQVGDLVDGNDAAGYGPLITRIVSATGPENWEGGETGSMTPFFLSRKLIVRNNAHVHRQIRDLLQEWRREAGLRGGPITHDPASMPVTDPDTEHAP